MENKRFSKNAILTIPNLISLFRILLSCHTGDGALGVGMMKEII